jgi:hypothetical protein
MIFSKSRSILRADEAFSRGYKDTPCAESVSPDTVDVAWTSDNTIVVQCAGKTFIHLILSDPDDDAPEFLCPDEDPVIVNLTTMNGTSLSARSDED